MSKKAQSEKYVNHKNEFLSNILADMKKNVQDHPSKKLGPEKTLILACIILKSPLELPTLDY